MPGWQSNGAPSWGYHGDDGGLFGGTNFRAYEGPKYAQGDVIGAGIDFTAGKMFFTKNGSLIGESHEHQILIP
jgi:Ran-binding protein 9/10